MVSLSNAIGTESQAHCARQGLQLRQMFRIAGRVKQGASKPLRGDDIHADRSFVLLNDFGTRL